MCGVRVLYPVFRLIVFETGVYGYGTAPPSLVRRNGTPTALQIKPKSSHLHLFRQVRTALEAEGEDRVSACIGEASHLLGRGTSIKQP